MTARSWQPSAERLAAVLERAPRIPLARRFVRIDRPDSLELTYTLEALVREAVGDGRLARERAHDILVAASGVRELVWSGRPVPFTEQVRIPVERAAQAAAALRHLP